MENIHTRQQTPEEIYFFSPRQESDEIELYKSVPETNDPMRYTEKVRQQQNYRRIREESMSRDQPPRLPCRPYSDNGDEYLWTCPGQPIKEYQQPRVDQRKIRATTLPPIDVCYTCMDHRLCLGPVCPARVLTCFYCESKEGPLRVRAKKLAKKIAERPRRFD